MWITEFSTVWTSWAKITGTVLESVSTEHEEKKNNTYEIQMPSPLFGETRGAITIAKSPDDRPVASNSK